MKPFWRKSTSDPHKSPDVEDRDYGLYSEPRECVCGEQHLERSIYWRHRLDEEAKVK